MPPRKDPLKHCVHLFRVNGHKRWRMSTQFHNSKKVIEHRTIVIDRLSGEVHIEDDFKKD